ncbi:MAG: DUF448 domain-containing protein [Desulfobacteraceae bacterium]|nr:DUF448 domain-containing protein [Desulfobacteraceae bacterium]
MRKHVPVRTCVVCGTKKAKSSLLRLGLGLGEKYVVLDCRGRMAGRGAYVCPDCLPRLGFTNRVRKAFRNEAQGIAEDILQNPSIRHSG